MTKTAKFGDIEIKTVLNATVPWYGVDGYKSMLAHQFGAHMAPAKFENAEAFVKALVESVEKHAESGRP